MYFFVSLEFSMYKQILLNIFNLKINKHLIQVKKKEGQVLKVPVNMGVRRLLINPR